MTERPPVGLLDTSVIIDLARIDPDELPVRLAVSAITLAELAAGTSATDDLLERARRQDQLQRAEATFDPIPFDAEAARAYGQICAAVRRHGRQPQRRVAGLQIAATAMAQRLPLLTRNPADFVGIAPLVRVIPV